MIIRPLISGLFVLLALFATAAGPITWKFTSEPLANGQVKVSMTAVCDEGWHIYALELPREDGPIPTSIHVAPAPSYTLKGAVDAPKAIEVDDPNFGMKLSYYTGTATFVAIVDRTGNEAFDISGEVEFMSCNDKTCLPPRTVKFTLPIEALK